MIEYGLSTNEQYWKRLVKVSFTAGELRKILDDKDKPNPEHHEYKQWYIDLKEQCAKLYSENMLNLAVKEKQELKEADKESSYTVKIGTVTAFYMDRDAKADQEPLIPQEPPTPQEPLIPQEPLTTQTKPQQTKPQDVVNCLLDKKEIDLNDEKYSLSWRVYNYLNGEQRRA